MSALKAIALKHGIEDLVHFASVPTTAWLEHTALPKIYTLGNGKEISMVPDESPAPADIESKVPYILDKDKLRRHFQMLQTTGISFTVSVRIGGKLRKFKWQLGVPKE